MTAQGGGDAHPVGAAAQIIEHGGHIPPGEGRQQHNSIIQFISKYIVKARCPGIRQHRNGTIVHRAGTDILRRQACQDKGIVDTNSLIQCNRRIVTGTTNYRTDHNRFCAVNRYQRKGIGHRHIFLVGGENRSSGHRQVVMNPRNRRAAHRVTDAHLLGNVPAFSPAKPNFIGTAPLKYIIGFRVKRIVRDIGGNGSKTFGFQKHCRIPLLVAGVGNGDFDGIGGAGFQVFDTRGKYRRTAVILYSCCPCGNRHIVRGVNIRARRGIMAGFTIRLVPPPHMDVINCHRRVVRQQGDIYRAVGIGPADTRAGNEEPEHVVILAARPFGIFLGGKKISEFHHVPGRHKVKRQHRAVIGIIPRQGLQVTVACRRVFRGGIARIVGALRSCHRSRGNDNPRFQRKVRIIRGAVEPANLGTVTGKRYIGSLQAPGDQHIRHQVLGCIHRDINGGPG
ncbi:MAG: hypothetical protein BWX80_01158 [Candidatus Hydrogenedentes bacterium ADurb.Bin101]|nr:MAG: hypothetical protein BWX80_01158 [Candidatus Hydrogenedentes bacterium ADurb.Bin101]